VNSRATSAELRRRICKTCAIQPVLNGIDK
jgi:hypothetical protein